MDKTYTYNSTSHIPRPHNHRAAERSVSTVCSPEWVHGNQYLPELGSIAEDSDRKIRGPCRRAELVWGAKKMMGRKKQKLLRLSCKRVDLLALGKVPLIVRRKVFKF